MNTKTDLDFHTRLLALLAERMQPTLYVEYGLGPGAPTIRQVGSHCAQAIGVDLAAPEDRRLINGRQFEVFEGTTDDFAKLVLPTLGQVELALIDADHSFEASLRDFEGLLPHMADHGIIALHDTFPENDDYLVPAKCHDSWQTAEYIRDTTVTYKVEVLTLPTPPGLTLVRKLGDHHGWTRTS